MNSVPKSRIILLFVWLLLGVTVFYAESLVPLLTDDYFYVLTRTAEGGFGTPITSFSEWFSTTCVMFLRMNARLANHSAALVLSLCGGRAAFTILNTFFLLGFIYALQRFFFTRNTLTTFLCAAGLTFAFLPCPEGTLLWADGSANYLWTMFLLILLFFPLRRMLRGELLSKKRFVVCALLAFIVGWFHESLSCPLCAALFFTWCFCPQARNKQVFFLTFCMGLGALMIMATPAVWNRAGANTTEPLMDICYSCLGMINFCLIPALLVIATAFVLRRKLVAFRQQWKAHSLDILFLLFVFFSFLLSALVGRIGSDGRGWYYLDLGLLFLMCRLVNVLIRQSGPTINRGITLCAGITLIVYCGLLLRAATFAHDAHQQVMAQIKEGRQVCVVDSTYRNRLIANWLPTSSPATGWYRSSGLVFHCKPFYTRVNEFVTDRSVYRDFEGLDETTPQVTRSGELTIVRLPKGLMTMLHRIKAEQSVPRHRDFMFLPSHSLFFDTEWIVVTARRKPLRTYGVDYYQGFHYLILLPEGDTHLTLHVPVMQEDTHEISELDIQT